MIGLELEIPVMIIPKESSIFCAAGMLMSDLKHDFVRTYPTILDELDRDKFRSLFQEMEEEARSLLQAELVDNDSVEFIYSLDMRYVKQYHEVNVKIVREEIENGNVEWIASLFHPEHDRLYGYSLQDRGTPVELITLRLTGIGRTTKPSFRQEDYGGEDSSKALKKKRKVYLPQKGVFEEIPVYDGHRLVYGNKVEGPAIIEQVNTTTFVSPEYSVLCDRFGSYTMYVKEKQDEIRKRLGITD
jgi:N-methylhydantoinase A